MRFILPSFRALCDSLKNWYANQFGEPNSPYTKLDPEFRVGLKEHATLSMLEKLAIHLEKRYGFRINSVSNLLLVLTVFLTSTFMLYDTITTP